MTEQDKKKLQTSDGLEEAFPVIKNKIHAEYAKFGLREQQPSSIINHNVIIHNIQDYKYG